MMRRESPPEKNVYFRAKNVDDRENIAKIEKKFPKTIPGPTRMLCVNFSPIGSVVLEKLEKTSIFARKRSKKVDNSAKKMKIQTIHNFFKDVI